MYPNFRWLKGYESRTLWGLHPYNLMLLSAMIDKKYDVKILDATKDNLTREQFTEFLKKEKPDAIGISVLTNEYGETGLIAAEIAKKVSPNIKTIFGGVYATSDYDNIIKNPYIDYVVVGEGEYILRELCDYFNGKGKLPKKGILYKKGKEIIHTPRAEFIEDLDELPMPSYHKVDFMRYATEIQRESVDRPRVMPYTHIFASRGCPFNCCFCAAGAISGKKIRYRSPENMIAEIEFLIKEYGIKSLILDDDNMLVNKEWARKFFQLMIDKKMNLKWNAIAMAVFKLNEEMLELMKKSGCEYINIAIESGVKRVLQEVIHKPIDLEYAKKMVSKMKELKIDITANFIIGFPGETWSEIRQTLKFAEELNADYTKIFIATPLPNTELYQIAKEKGYLRPGFSFNQHLWTDGWIETEEFRPEDLKILRAYEWDRINFLEPVKRKKIAEMMGITKKRLDGIRKQTFIRANP